MENLRDELVVSELQEIRATLDEHSRQLEVLRRLVEQLIKRREPTVYLPEEIERPIPSRSERDMRLDQLILELEKLPPDELRRQIERADAVLSEELSCQTPP